MAHDRRAESSAILVLAQAGQFASPCLVCVVWSGSERAFRGDGDPSRWISRGAGPEQIGASREERSSLR